LAPIRVVESNFDVLRQIHEARVQLVPSCRSLLHATGSGCRVPGWAMMNAMGVCEARASNARSYSCARSRLPFAVCRRSQSNRAFRYFFSVLNHKAIRAFEFLAEAMAWSGAKLGRHPHHASHSVKFGPGSGSRPNTLRAEQPK